MAAPLLFMAKVWFGSAPACRTPGTAEPAWQPQITTIPRGLGTQGVDTGLLRNVESVEPEALSSSGWMVSVILTYFFLFFPIQPSA